MQSVTKRDLVDQIAAKTDHKRATVREITQEVLNAITAELVQGHRIEMRDFGVFVPIFRPAKIAQNPKTLEPVKVEAKYSVRFKPGRLMKEEVASGDWAQSMLDQREGEANAETANNGTTSDGPPIVHTVGTTTEVQKNF